MYMYNMGKIIGLINVFIYINTFEYDDDLDVTWIFCASLASILELISENMLMHVIICEVCVEINGSQYGEKALNSGLDDAAPAHHRLLSPA